MDWHYTEENPSEEEFEVSREWFKMEMISLLACLLFCAGGGWGKEWGRDWNSGDKDWNSSDLHVQSLKSRV